MTESQDFSRGAAAPARAISDPITVALDLRAAGLPKQALAVLSGATGASAELYNLRGDLQLELGQTDEAVRSYTAVIASDSSNMYAQFQLADCLQREKRWDAAALAFQDLLAYDPERDQIRIRLGECLLQMNRMEDALVCFDQCWSEPFRLPALFGKAVAFQLLRRFDEAEATYERVLGIDPSAEEALSNLIAMSMEVFDLQRVHRYSTRLLQVSPQSAVAMQGLALVAVERREYTAAARHFSRLIERPSDGEASRNEENGDAIEYRLSREVVEHLNTIRSQRFTSPEKQS
jgi:tetratricopeptide (TPR) repeat protein